jgi:hypothetical protein
MHATRSIDPPRSLLQELDGLPADSHAAVPPAAAATITDNSAATRHDDPRAPAWCVGPLLLSPRTPPVVPH